ncbi:hypothetical protein GCM10008959_20620 [Deinococcus seoulensis]|uniref:AlgX/AlgJ SGNH hydrolase-like domain-containing protein n=1 Tax=Deinococcus seoulensis TaxID=1837379 RepID=A0ABQ2RUT0_9DEIO|nr:hypothetical protein [Deinococcus seoulensis]GGR58769.1 hypothetical protein GCM10008959_20620 [Deinococcus seoulensis]
MPVLTHRAVLSALTLLSAALIAAPARAAATPATAVPASCGVTLDQKAWMFQGEQGFYYYGDELSGRWMNRPWNEARAAFVPATARLAAALKAQGVTLVMAPVPPRSFVQPHLNLQNPTQKAFDLSGAQGFYRALVSDLRAAGLPTADLLTPALAQGDAGVFRQDIHWTPEGAQAAAKATADTVRAAGQTAGTAPFVSIRAGTVTRQVQDQPVLGQIQALCGLSVPPETYGDYQAAPAAPLVAAAGNFGASEGSVRWAFGPVATVSFVTATAGKVEVNATFETPLDGQGVEVVSGGKVIDTVSGLKRGETVTRTWTVDAAAGQNSLDLRFADYNGGKTSFAPGDSRPMAVIFKTLTVQGSGGSGDLIKIQSGGDLLGAAADTVLVGASSSLPSLNYAGFLQAELSRRIDNVSFGGAGVFSSLKDYLLDEAYALSKPGTLIWQIPLLGGDDTAESDLRFVTAAARGAGTSVAAASGTGSARVTVPGLSTAAARVRVSDPATRTVTFKVTSDQGTREFRVTNSERMTHRQDFLLDLGGLGSVTAVEVAAAGTLELQVVN